MGNEEKITESFDLQAFLIEAMRRIVNGELEPERANVIAELAQTIHDLDKLELERELLKRAPKR